MRSSALIHSAALARCYGSSCDFSNRFNGLEWDERPRLGRKTVETVSGFGVRFEPG